MSTNNYAFLEEDPKYLTSELNSKFNMINNYTTNRGIIARWYKSFYSYYGYYYSDPKARYGMGTTGPQGELTSVAINQYRNLIQHILALVTQNKISFDCIPENSDVDGRNASIVGNSLLEYIFEKSKYSQEIYRMAEIGLIFGTSFVFPTWQINKHLHGIDSDNQPIYSGDLSLKTFTPLDVLLEPFKERFEDQEWICCRQIVNRYDVINQFPHKKEEILRAMKVEDIQTFDPYFATDTDHIWIYTVYHKSTPALPLGRLTIWCGDNVILKDLQPNPYCQIDPETFLPIMGTGIPAICFRPAVTYGSAWGHTPGFDLLPLQDVKNMLASTIASNQAVFGVQNLIVARGTNMDFADLGTGLRVMEVDFNPDLGPSMGAPSVLDLLKTPQEIFNYNNKIDEEMEKISGINGALRGTPPPQISSGTAMALLTTQAQTFNTTIEKSYIDCIQNIANQILRIMAKFMPYKDISKMVGIKDNYAIPSFKAVELSKIQTVKILTGNALSKSPAGRLTIAENMLNSGQITASEYIEVVNTGTIKNKVEDITAEEALIQYENQQMLQGKEVPVLLTDNPLKHILGHMVSLNHPDVRNDPQKQSIIEAHIAKHQQNWVVLGKQNPQLLALITGSPIPPDVPEEGVVGKGEATESPVGEPPERALKTDFEGVAKNNLQNASTPGGDVDLAASALRSASKLIQKTG